MIALTGAILFFTTKYKIASAIVFAAGMIIAIGTATLVGLALQPM